MNFKEYFFTRPQVMAAKTYLDSEYRRNGKLTIKQARELLAKRFPVLCPCYDAAFDLLEATANFGK